MDKEAEKLPIPGAEALPVKLTRYDRLVEDAIAEKVSDDEGLPKEMTTRVVAAKAADGVPQLHIFGRNPEAVDRVADGISSRDREIYRHYIGRRVSPEEEAATIRPVLTDIIRNMPATIGSPEEILKEAKGLPLVETPALTEADIKSEVDKLAEEGSPFQKLGENLNKAIEGGSKDGEQS